MPARATRLLAIVAVLVPISLAATGASAAPGPGTFTKITTPANGIIIPLDVTGPNALTISGQTSPDVTSVDIICLYQSFGVQTQDLATAVPVAGGAFTTDVDVSGPMVNCRLRAIPTGVDPTTAYLASYSGPVVYTNEISRSQDNGTKIGYLAIGEQGSGNAFAEDAGTCGAVFLATIPTPSMDLLGPNANFCAFNLVAGNITSTGTSDASALRVDGHNAYLPAGIERFLIDERGLTVTPRELNVTFTRTATGDITATESAPLVRCSVDDTYPPTPASCPDVVNTGVKFVRTLNIFRGAHQIRMRDSFASTDSAVHSVSAQYAARFVAAPTGAPGYIFPGGSNTYSTASPDEVVLGLGSKAGTLLLRSDIHSLEGDPAADTVALTWSRAPSKVQFDHFGNATFAMPYSLHVPAAGKAFLGFAVSEGNTTSTAKSIASVAINEMVLAPKISSPKSGATIKGHLTTVKGTVSRGANGLPTSVTVNGHAAKLTKVNATTDSYAVTFSESFGKHKLTVTAKDVAGNTKSATRTVTNTS